MSDKPENREQEKLTEDQREDFATKSNDYNELKGIATLGLNVALFGNTVADMKNCYDIKATKGSADILVVLWLLRLSFCFQLCVALLAVFMYMIKRKDNKGDKKKEQFTYTRMHVIDFVKPEPKSRFQGSLCCGLSLYKMLYLTSLICILIITFLQIIASIWSASLGIELKSANDEVYPYNSHPTMNPNFTTTTETATSANVLRT